MLRYPFLRFISLLIHNLFQDQSAAETGQTGSPDDSASSGTPSGKVRDTATNNDSGIDAKNATAEDEKDMFEGYA